MYESIEALKLYPNIYCSEYIGYRPGESYRLLQIGERSFWYHYKSANDWRSNCGEVEIGQPIEIELWWMKFAISHNNPPAAVRPIKLNDYPIFAIDFIDSEIGKLAIDLNTAPGLKYTGMEQLMSPVAIYSEVSKFMRSHI